MENKIIKNKISDHYHQADLGKNIHAAFEGSGRQIKDYKDTANLDEFHIRGRAATRELARLAAFKPGMSVLDLGCGIGGPARMLAAEFGCYVTGVDLMGEYCETATMISNQVGLSDMVAFQQADMTALSFDDQIFDAAWTLHTIMNIKDKSGLFDNVCRVLKPGGRFAVYEICAGEHSPPYFPVPWASDAAMSFLLKPADLQQRILNSGFLKLEWVDVSSDAKKWFEEIAAKRAVSDTKHIKKTGPGISLLLGKTAAVKSKNVFRNLKGDRIRTVFGVFEKPE